MYNWQFKNWPNFTYAPLKYVEEMQIYISRVSYLNGRFSALGGTLRLDTEAETLATEAIHTSRIEGENYDLDDLKSSILNNLDPKIKNRHVADYRAEGLGKLMTYSRSTFDQRLTVNQLFYWHELLLDYRKDLKAVGNWRQSTAPMQIISGTVGKERVHFEAPPSDQVPKEMDRYVDWFNETKHDSPISSFFFAPIRAGIAHLYFESIHPFEDGNGRIGRILAEKALSQALPTPLPFSLSYGINQNKKAYYTALNKASLTLEIDEWLQYFIDTCFVALEAGEQYMDHVIKKFHFFDQYSTQLDSRQEKALLKMFAAGPKGFQGGMTAKKYIHINRVSRATATRDLQYLVKIGALQRIGEGRSTRYEIASF